MSSSEEQNAEINENDLSFLQQEEDPSGSAEASGEPGEVSPHGDEPNAQEPVEASEGGTVDEDVTALTDEAEASGEGGNGAGPPFPGTDWGYVDEEGNVRQKDTPDGPGRIVGQMKGSDPNAALRFYVNKFRQITQRLDALERDMANEAQRARVLGRIQSMIEGVPTAEALGDFDAVLERLRALEAQALEAAQRNLEQKEALCARAEELSESSSWKATGEALKALQEEWKAVGPAPKEQSDAVWKRFRAAQSRFFDRRKEHFGRLAQEQQENFKRKEELAARAEELAESSDWKATAESLKSLQDEWKAVGPAPRDQADAVWKRFRKGLNRFFDRRKEHFDRLGKEQKENYRRKEELCVRAEEVAESSDWKATAETLKSLQEEWRTIGPAPKDKAEAVWARFRAANDKFFNRRAEHFQERDKDRGARQAEWKERLQESLERKREQVERLKESIGRDRDNVERWQASLAAVRPGPREAELRESLEVKITDVGKRLQSKESRLVEIEDSIKEIEAKL